MAYRDDLEAAAERAAALERELADAQAENQRLKQALEHPPDLADAGAAPAHQAREVAARAQLAREGRARKDLEARRREQREAEAANAPLDARRWLRIGSSALGFTRYGWFYYGLPLMIMPVMLPLGLLFGEKRIPWILLTELCAALVIIASGLFASARSSARTLAWIAGLPFRVDNLMACFGNSATRYGRIVVAIDWSGEPPALEALRGFVGDAAEIEAEGRRLRVETYTSRSALEANRRIFKLTTRLIDGILVPMHRLHPIASVRFQPNG